MRYLVTTRHTFLLKQFKKNEYMMRLLENLKRQVDIRNNCIEYTKNGHQKRIRKDCAKCQERW